MVTDVSKRRSRITFEFFVRLFVVRQIFELAVFQTSSLPLLNWRLRYPETIFMPWKKIKFIRQFSGQLACTSPFLFYQCALIRLDCSFISSFSPFLTADSFYDSVADKALMFIWKGPRRLWNGHALPRSFLARTNSQEIVVAKFEGEIIRLKELCTHMEIIVERLRRMPLFLYNKV